MDMDNIANLNWNKTKTIVSKPKNKQFHKLIEVNILDKIYCSLGSLPPMQDKQIEMDLGDSKK